MKEEWSINVNVGDVFVFIGFIMFEIWLIVVLEVVFKYKILELGFM